MPPEPLDSKVSARICKHMNSDHKDAVKKYALFYGGIEKIEEASIISLNKDFMELEVDQKIIQINFEHTLLDSDDAHKTLVSMLKRIPS